MTANSTSTVEYIGGGGTSGTSFGQSGEKISFFGATPVVKQTSSGLAGLASTSGNVISTTLAASTGGLNTSAGADGVINAINALASILYTYGLATS